MITSKKKFYKFFTIYLPILFISFLISLHLPGFNWETDYGHYYYISMFNNSSTKLYQDFFLHKGPGSIFLLDFISLFIGKGWKQSIISYFIIISFFFFIVRLFISSKSKNYLFFIISLIFFLTFFRNQGSNMYVELVLNLFLFSSFLFYHRIITGKSINNLYFFTLFFSLAVLTRIDVIIYTIPFIIIFTFFLYREKKIKLLNLKLIILNIFIFFSLISIFSYFYNFSLNDYLLNNITFNLEYSENFSKFKNISYLYHLTPNKILICIILVKSFFYFKEDMISPRILKYLLVTISIIQSFFFYY